MELRKNKKLYYTVSSICLLACAAVIRELAREEDYILLETILQFSRHLIHASLLFIWMSTIKQRIMQASVRRYLLASGTLLILWLYIRTCKWMFFPSDTWTNRYCWYAYYIALIFIPLFGVFVIQCLGKSEDYKLPEKWKLLYLPAIILLLLVFTNDLHQLVFCFPDGSAFSDDYYTYGSCYLLVSGWSILLGLYFVLSLLWQCRAPGRPWFQKIPVLVMLSEVAITILYCMNILKCDVTALNCAMIVLLLESCIQSGLIRSNSKYDRLFEIANIEAHIADENGKIRYVSGQAQQPEAQVRTWMTDLEHDGIVMDGKRLKCAKLTRGWILWWEDVSEIMTFTEALENAGKQLSEKNDLMKAELELREKKLQVEEKNRLYDRITEEVTAQLDQVERLLKKKDEKEEKKQLAHICVLSAYIKRRCNLALIAENASLLQAKELSFCLKESAEMMELYGIMVSVDSSCQGETKAEYLIAVYDTFEQLIEQILDQTDAMLLNVHMLNNQICMKIQMNLEKDWNIPQWNFWYAVGGSVNIQQMKKTWYLEFTMKSDLV